MSIGLIEKCLVINIKISFHGKIQLAEYFKCFYLKNKKKKEYNHA